MKKILNAFNILLKDRRLFFSILLQKFGFIFPDRFYLCLLFYLKIGKRLNLKNPKTFNEKLQWLKLYDRKKIYTTLVDKFAVKKYVADKIGEQYVIPTLGVWENFDDVDFTVLPNRFVMKCTHDSGGIVICKDRNDLDMKKVRNKIMKSMRRNYYKSYREWPYKNVRPRIIVEEYMEDSKTKELRDYKFFCFDGVVQAMFIASDRQNEREDTKFDFFDKNFNHLALTNGHPNASVLPNKPEKFDEMIHLCELLSKGIPQVRVDFYEVDSKVFFGEMTFAHWGGFTPFQPSDWDYKFGSWITLPKL